MKKMNVETSKLLVITGSYPPEKCGAGDYLCNLFQTQEAKNWTLLYIKDWRLRNIFKIIKQINNFSEKNINVQFPTMGYSKSITIELLCLFYGLTKKKNLSITTHEHSELDWKRRLISNIIYPFASKLIFTTEFERNSVAKKFPNILKRSKIIKIYSNIKQADFLPQIADRQYDIGYFGFIKNGKGIEEFLEVSRKIKSQKECKIYIMGQIQPEYKNYAAQIIEQAKNFQIDCKINQNEQKVAETLANTKIAFLPFPDGISERRGSFLAVVQNRCVVVSTQGKQTTEALKKCSVLVDKKSAFEKILQLFENDELMVEYQQKISEYKANEMPKSWSEIARVYNEFLLKK